MKEQETMLKVNEFEMGIDVPDYSRKDNLVFHDLANEHFRYDNAKDLLDTDNGRKVFRDMLQTFFEAQKPRLEALDSYAKGNNYSILAGQRRLDKEKADYRVRHKWGGYISAFVTSYVVGNPITVGVTHGADKSQLEAVSAIEWENDINALNTDLAFDTSRFGRAFEYHFRDKNSVDRVVLIDPREMFVIRDVTVENNVIAAVHVPIFQDKVHMTFYTADKVITFNTFAPSSVRLVVETTTQHSYGDVPVVEWWNNRFRMGDYESEISLIDAYDAGQSDSANYMSDQNDAMLLIKGDVSGSGLTAEASAKMKEANMLILQSGMSADGKQTNVDADYIHKQYDVAGTEAYKNRLANDIHRFSRIPNLEDDRFGMTASGVALMYKMIGLEQVRTEKQAYYTKALRRRYELISNVHKVVNGSVIEADKLTFTFHPNVPQDVWVEIKAYIEAGGQISQETLMETATFTDYKNEQKRLMKENGAIDFELSQFQGSDADESEGV